MSTDEAKKRTTYRTEVSGKRTRATLGNRFHQGKARQVWLPVLVSVGGYLLRVGGGFSYKGKNRDDSGKKKKLKRKIVPRFGLPVTIGFDNGPAFVSQIVQSLALALGTKWKLHCKYSPQSSGQVKRINRTLKNFN